MIVWSSNYRRIINHFRKTINNYFNLLFYYNQPINNENIVNKNNDFSINNINSDNLEKTFDNNIHFVINKLSLPQLYELLYELGICSKSLTYDNDENENPIQEEEKMLVIQLYEILKDEDEMVKNDKLFKFFISVLG